MRTAMTTKATLVAAVALLTVAGAVQPAVAADDFGQHVRTCAQTMGFSGEHNPGMHQGFHGWNREHLC